MQEPSDHLIGIMSDTHGQAGPVRKALQLFDNLGVAEIIICGDLGGQPVFDELIGRRCSFVWGNMDDADSGTRAYLKTVGLGVPGQAPMQLERSGKRILVFHGHEAGFHQALGSQSADYILHGHTHVRRDERIGSTRVVNPGALCRAKVLTVATLDITKDLVQFYEIAS